MQFMGQEIQPVELKLEIAWRFAYCLGCRDRTILFNVLYILSDDSSSSSSNSNSLRAAMACVCAHGYEPTVCISWK